MASLGASWKPEGEAASQAKKNAFPNRAGKSPSYAQATHHAARLQAKVVRASGQGRNIASVKRRVLRLRAGAFGVRGFDFRVGQFTRRRWKANTRERSAAVAAAAEAAKKQRIAKSLERPPRTVLDGLLGRARVEVRESVKQPTHVNGAVCCCRCYCCCWKVHVGGKGS